jgi:putative ABC transport system permease protein
MCRERSNISQMMVNRSFANTYLNGPAALGRHLEQPGNTYMTPAEIAGIVGDARETGLDHEPVPTIYWCTNANQPGTYFLARTHGDPAAMSETVRRKIHEIEPQRSVYNLTPLAEHISDAYAENRMRTILLAFFAATAIALACVGLYGTLSYLVNMRQREVGLRLALGALRSQIVRQFLTQGLLISLAGCIAGLALAAAFTRLLAGMLFGVSAWDAPTLAVVVALVLIVSAMASLLPAIRAARLEPMRVLRDE